MTHDEVALVAVSSSLLQARDSGLCHLEQARLLGRVAVDLVVHVRVVEQSEVRLRRSLRIAAVEGIEARAVRKDVVAALARKLKSVGAVRAGRAGGRVGHEEAESAAKEDVNHGSEGRAANELLRDEVLVITVVDVRGE